MSDTKEVAISTSSTLTKECPSCGKLNSVRNTYCVRCRTRLPETPSSEVRVPTGELTIQPPTPSTTGPLVFSDMSSIQALLATRISTLQLRQLYFDLGIVLSQQGEYDKAVEAFQSALNVAMNNRESPGTFDIRLYLAYILEEAGNSEQSFHAYLEAVFETSLDETSVAHSILSHMQSLLTSDIVISQGEWAINECLPRLSNTAIPVPVRRDVALLVFRLYLYLASYKQAEEILGQAMAIAPDKVPVAAEELLAADKLPPNLAIFSTDIDASYILARLFAKTENTRQATFYIDHALELLSAGNGTAAKSLSPSFDPDAYQLKAHLQAKVELSNANDRKEVASQALLETARNYYFKNELKLALALFREAKELNPGQQLIYWYLADCLRMLSLENPSYVKDSVEIWEQGYAIQPMDDDNSWAYLVRGLLYELQSNQPTVDSWVQAWCAVCCIEQTMMYPSANNSLNYAYLGRFYRNVQLEANALQATEKAVQLDGNNTFALAERAVILANVGEFEQAEKVIDAWIKLEPGTALRDGIQGFVYCHLGRKEEGFDLLTKAIKEDESVLARL